MIQLKGEFGVIPNPEEAAKKIESVYLNIDNAIFCKSKNKSVMVTAHQIRNVKSTINFFCETTLVRRVNLPK